MSRKKREYVVVEQTKETASLLRSTPSFPDTQTALKWLKEHGKDDHVYFVMAICAGPLTFKTEITCRARLESLEADPE